MGKIDIDGDLIRQLADLMNETGLTEIEVGAGDMQIRVAKQMQAAPVHYAQAPMAAPDAAAPAAAAAAQNKNGVKSPMVGTAYLAAEPSAPAFVKVGDSVTVGQTLLIIEAMKVMNPIKAEKGGVVKEILVSNAQPVEFGEILLVIE